jgi:hypothetical protein
MLSGFSCKAIPAVYRLIVVRLKRDFRLFAALGAGSGIHLARASIAIASTAFIPETLCSFCRTARRATPGFIGEAFGSEELLLFNSKGESFSAIGTCNRFLCVSH